MSTPFLPLVHSNFKLSFLTIIPAAYISMQISMGLLLASENLCIVRKSDLPGSYQRPCYDN